MTFETVAREIVSDTIRSAVCIDDRFAEPYEENLEGLDTSLPRILFNSFREHDCTLDIYRYRSFGEWERDRNRLLKNTDLLILDWQLNDGAIRFEESLKILDEAVSRGSLPFVIIYTNATNLEEVGLHILAYFSKAAKDDTSTKIKKLADLLEEELDIDEAEEFFSDMAAPLKELVLADDQEIFKERKKEFVKRLKNHFEIQYRDFKSVLVKAFENNDDNISLKILGLKINNAFFREEANFNGFCKLVAGQEHTLFLDHTLIKLSSKDIVQPDQVYNEFASVICRHPHNFIAILGLELRNLIRDNALLIDRDIKLLDELAFFHHRSKLGVPIDFETFLKETWKDQLASFVMYQSPKSLRVIPDYMEQYGIDDDALATFRQNVKLSHRTLGMLNHYYSMLQLNRSQDDLIRFGDVFLLKDLQNGVFEATQKYLLCITPHCDCVRPQKLDHNLLFVKGSSIKLKTALKQGDSGYVTYLLPNDDPMAIEWVAKPFTIYIPTNENNIDKAISAQYLGKKRELEYQGTQKENHTQRVANQAMNYAIRVGIDLAKL